MMHLGLCVINYASAGVHFFFRQKKNQTIRKYWSSTPPSVSGGGAALADTRRLTAEAVAVMRLKMRSSINVMRKLSLSAPQQQRINTQLPQLLRLQRLISLFSVLLSHVKLQRAVSN